VKTLTSILKIVFVLSGVGLVVYAVRMYRSKKRYTRVSEEGYETAYDILFPAKKDRRKKVQYGPVIPGRLAI
jgi:hypothetical protein